MDSEIDKDRIEKILEMQGKKIYELVTIVHHIRWLMCGFIFITIILPWIIVEVLN